MRFVLAIAAVAALTFTANAEPTYVSGGPVIQGGMCAISTDGGTVYGYLAPCAPTAATSKKKKS